MKKRNYTGLKTLAQIYRAVGILIAVGGVLLALLAMSSDDPAGAAVVLVGGCFAALVHYAVGEFILMFINMAQDNYIAAEATRLHYQLVRDRIDKKRNAARNRTPTPDSFMRAGVGR